MNAKSSRSHIIVNIEIKQVDLKETNQIISTSAKMSTISLVDLAGSEKSNIFKSNKESNQEGNS